MTDPMAPRSRQIGLGRRLPGCRLGDPYVK